MKKNESQENNNLNEIDIHQLYSEVLANKWKVVLITVVFFIFGLLFAISIKPKFQTSALIQMNRADNSISSISSLASLVGSMSNIQQQATPSMLEQTLLKSRYVLGPVITELGLDIIAKPHHFPFFGRFANDADNINVSHLKVPSSLLEDTLTITKTGKTKFSVKDGDQLLLKNGTIGQLSTSKIYPAFQINVTKLIGTAGSEFSVVKMRMDDAIQALNKALTIDDNNPTNLPYTDTGVLQLTYSSHKAEKAVKVLNTIIDTAYESGIKQQSMEAQRVISFLNQQIPTVKKRLQAAENALSNYEAKTGNVGAGGGEAGLSAQARFVLQEVANINQQIEQLKLKKTELSQLYTSTHPYIITINKKIKDVEKQKLLYEQKIKDLPISDKVAVSLVRDVKTENQLYLMLLGKLQELQVLRAGVISNMKILDRAAEPPKQLPSHRGLIVLVSIILGLFLSIAMVILKLLFRNGVQDPEYIEEMFGISVNAIVPYSKNQGKLSASIKRSIIKKPRILAEEYPSDMSIESIRSLRTNLQLASMESDKRIICVSGLTPGIGKSFISLNLAYTLAQVQKDVLLIDIDIRKGKIHQSFGIDPMPGFTDLMADDVELEDTIIHTYQNSPNLHFIPRGTIHKNPAELLQSHRFEKFFEKIKDEFSTIIIDTPPILAVSDPLHIMKRADINYLLLSAGRHTKREISQAFNLLKVNNIKLDAAIFNFAEPTSARNYHYYTGYSYSNYEAYANTDKEHVSEQKTKDEKLKKTQAQKQTKESDEK